MLNIFRASLWASFSTTKDVLQTQALDPCRLYFEPAQQSPAGCKRKHILMMAVHISSKPNGFRRTKYVTTRLWWSSVRASSVPTGVLSYTRKPLLLLLRLSTTTTTAPVCRISKHVFRVDCNSCPLNIVTSVLQTQAPSYPSSFVWPHILLGCGEGAGEQRWGLGSYTTGVLHL